MSIEKTESNNNQDIKEKILSAFLYCFPKNNDYFKGTEDIPLTKKPSDYLAIPNGIFDFFRILDWYYEIDKDFVLHETFAKIIDHCEKNPKKEESESVPLKLIHSFQKKMHKLFCF